MEIKVYTVFVKNKDGVWVVCRTNARTAGFVSLNKGSATRLRNAMLNVYNQEDVKVVECVGKI